MLEEGQSYNVYNIPSLRVNESYNSRLLCVIIRSDGPVEFAGSACRRTAFVHSPSRLVESLNWLCLISEYISAMTKNFRRREIGCFDITAT